MMPRLKAEEAMQSATIVSVGFGGDKDGTLWKEWQQAAGIEKPTKSLEVRAEALALAHQSLGIQTEHVSEEEFMENVRRSQAEWEAAHAE